MAGTKASQGRRALSLGEIAPSDLPRRRPRRTRRRWPSLRNIAALVLREMSTTYGRSPGGYLWALAEPLGMIIVLSIAFSLLLRTPSLGTSFILFYASGFLPFNLYQKAALTVSGSIGFSKALLLYPVVSWLDAILARFVLNTLTAIVVTALLLPILLFATGTNVVLDMLPMIRALIYAALLGLGIGTLNCVLFGLFPVYANAWRIVTRPLFIASAVLYIYEDLPKVASDIIWYNPLVHVTGLMRTGLYPTYAPQYISEAYVLACALIPLVFGLMLLRRHYRTILNR